MLNAALLHTENVYIQQLFSLHVKYYTKIFFVPPHNSAKLRTNLTHVHLGTFTIQTIALHFFFIISLFSIRINVLILIHSFKHLSILHVKSTQKTRLQCRDTKLEKCWSQIPHNMENPHRKGLASGVCFAILPVNIRQDIMDVEKIFTICLFGLEIYVTYFK